MTFYRTTQQIGTLEFTQSHKLSGMNDVWKSEGDSDIAQVEMDWCWSLCSRYVDVSAYG